jgi:hypothetical protein
MNCLPTAFAAALAAALLPGPALAGPISDGATPGTRIEALDLKLDGGGMMTLTLKIYNDGDRSLDLISRMQGDGAGDSRDVSGMYLVDAANKKRYLPVKDTAGKCVCTIIQGAVAAKSSMTIWAKFAATPATVKTVSAMVPLFLPLDGVPVTGP